MIPYIAKEEEKMEEETRKLLGQMNGTKVVSATFAMSAQCNRVAVEDGHTESVSIRLKRKAKPEEMIAAWNSFRAEPQELQLPSAPKNPVVYFGAPDRPQPRFDIDLGAGMTTAVGRLRPCGVLDWKFTVLSHNTIRGAAGAAVDAVAVGAAGLATRRDGARVVADRGQATCVSGEAVAGVDVCGRLCDAGTVPSVSAPAPSPCAASRILTSPPDMRT